MALISFTSEPAASSINAPHCSFPLKIRRNSLSFPRPLSRRSLPAVSVSAHTYDVVVIGAGIIGLTIARELLAKTELSVAVVDRALPCAGATGAGQGYIWMVHKSPKKPTWNLSLRSRALWERFAEDVKLQGLDPSRELGWKKTGSLLIGRNESESHELKNKVTTLNAAGLTAEFLDAHRLREAEPDLDPSESFSAALLPDDFQIDAQATVSHILKSNRSYASVGRYAEFFNDPVMSLQRSQSGDISSVLTSQNTLNLKKALVIATGCWTGYLMRELFSPADGAPDVPVQPRKGHLLVVENTYPLTLRHGMMELGYAGHEATRPDGEMELLSVSMTATIDTGGNVLLGSSRQFAGFDSGAEGSIVRRIWNRAGEFFPKLRERDFTSGNVRVGLRPYLAGGKPVIGNVPGFGNAFLAAGHEGEGLCLALGTAELVVNMVLESTSKINGNLFAFPK